MPVEGLVGTRVCGCVFVSGQDWVGAQEGGCCVVQVGGDGGFNSSGCHGNRETKRAWRWLDGGPEEVGRTGWLPGVGRCPRLTHR